MSLIPTIALCKEGLPVFSKATNMRLKYCLFDIVLETQKRRNTNPVCKTNHLLPYKKPPLQIVSCSFLYVFVSDLKDAGPTRNAPCNPETKCKTAYKQNLAGCNAATGRCICSRGYVMSEGTCTGRIHN